MIKRQGCGFRDHVHYGLFMGTKILNTFIAEPPKDLGKIKWWDQECIGWMVFESKVGSNEDVEFF